MASKLKPCPFCGGEARLIGHHPYSITCCKCRATTVICHTPDDAIDAWNRCEYEAAIAYFKELAKIAKESEGEDGR